MVLLAGNLENAADHSAFSGAACPAGSDGTSVAVLWHFARARPAEQI